MQLLQSTQQLKAMALLTCKSVIQLEDYLGAKKHSILFTDSSHIPILIRNPCHPSLKQLLFLEIFIA